MWLAYYILFVKGKVGMLDKAEDDGEGFDVLMLTIASFLTVGLKICLFNTRCVMYHGIFDGLD